MSRRECDYILEEMARYNLSNAPRAEDTQAVYRWMNNSIRVRNNFKAQYPECQTTHDNPYYQEQRRRINQEYLDQRNRDYRRNLCRDFGSESGTWIESTEECIR